MAGLAGGGIGASQPTLWVQQKPCYSKVSNAAVVALCLHRKSPFPQSTSLEDRMLWLHRLHMELDAIVVAHGATKFCGTHDSYLVVKVFDNEADSTKETRELGNELLEAAKDVAVVRAVSGYGEVGFGVLGSTGWNYQFYGEFINSMRQEAAACSPGYLHDIHEGRSSFEKGEKQSSSPTGELVKGDAGTSCEDFEREDLPSPNYDEWRARNLQHTELWVLVIILLLSILAMLGALEKTKSNKEIKVIPFVLQMQCFCVNLFAIGVWFVNREKFLANHQRFMMLVWVCQFLNRFIGTMSMPLAPKELFHLYPTFRMIAANGPEKLLLTTVPMVGTISSLVLHFFGTASAVIFSLRSCSAFKPDGDVSLLPFECQETGQMYFIIANIIFSLGIPVLYARYSDMKAKEEYLNFKVPKAKKKI